MLGKPLSLLLSSSPTDTNTPVATYVKCTHATLCTRRTRRTLTLPEVFPQNSRRAWRAFRKSLSGLEMAIQMRLAEPWKIMNVIKMLTCQQYFSSFYQLLIFGNIILLGSNHIIIKSSLPPPKIKLLFLSTS